MTQQQWELHRKTFCETCAKKGRCRTVRQDTCNKIQGGRCSEFRMRKWV